MNERIRKLAEQSYEATTVTTIDPVTQEVVVDFIDGTKPFFNQEKFAELIVAECVEQILTGIRTNPPQAHPPELVQILVRRIQQHFGVEL